MANTENVCLLMQSIPLLLLLLLLSTFYRNQIIIITKIYMQFIWINAAVWIWIIIIIIMNRDTYVKLHVAGPCSLFNNALYSLCVHCAMCIGHCVAQLSYLILYKHYRIITWQLIWMLKAKCPTYSFYTCSHRFSYGAQVHASPRK